MKYSTNQTKSDSAKLLIDIAFHFEMAGCLNDSINYYEIVGTKMFEMNSFASCFSCLSKAFQISNSIEFQNEIGVENDLEIRKQQIDWLKKMTISSGYLWGKFFFFFVSENSETLFF